MSSTGLIDVKSLVLGFSICCAQNGIMQMWAEIAGSKSPRRCQPPDLFCRHGISVQQKTWSRGLILLDVGY